MKKTIYFLLFILLLTTVLSVKPVMQSSTNVLEELNIIYPKNAQFPLNGALELHFHVFNSTGIVMTNISVNYCTFHLYNLTNKHLIKKNLTYDGVEWDITIPAINFDKIGVYPYLVWCKGVHENGFVSDSLVISENGVTYEGRAYTNIAMLILLIVVLVMYLIMAINWDFTLFENKKDNKNNAVKGLLIWLIVWLIPAFIQFGVEIGGGFGATQDMLTLLNVFYQVSIWIGITISTYFVVFFVYNVALLLAGKGGDYKR